MGSNSSLTFSGEITKAKFVENMNSPDVGIQGILNNVGAFAVEEMRAITRPSDSSGSLTDSITWQTISKGSAKGSRAKATDVIEKPTEAYTVLIGTATKHGIYRETFSGLHKTAEGSAEFIASMKEWVKREMGLNADGTPEERFHFYNILNQIRNTRTEGTPFVKPTTPKIMPYALKEMRKALILFFRRS